MDEPADRDLDRKLWDLCHKAVDVALAADSTDVDAIDVGLKVAHYVSFRDGAWRRPAQRFQDEAVDPDLLRVDPISLDVGSELARIADTSAEDCLLERLMQVRRNIADEYGVITPPVRVVPDLGEAAGSISAVSNAASNERRRRLRDRLLSDITALSDDLEPTVVIAPDDHRRAAFELLRSALPSVRVLAAREVAGVEADVIGTIGAGVHVARITEPSGAPNNRPRQLDSAYLDVAFTSDDPDDIEDVDVID